jgi:hypothetical protein
VTSAFVAREVESVLRASRIHLHWETEMNKRKPWDGGPAILPCLALALAALMLPGCGKCKSTDPSCSSSPSPTPPPPPVQVTRVVASGSGSIQSKFVAPVVFTTTASGTVGIEVNWTFATNDVDIFLTRGNDPCTVDTLNARSCGIIATEESTSMKPERLSVPNLAAGTYTLYIANFGDRDESVAYQVTLTSASAGSGPSATTATVQRGAAKGTLNGILEPR